MPKSLKMILLILLKITAFYNDLFYTSSPLLYQELHITANKPVKAY